MADIATDDKVISKKNEGFPEWLDFDKLRAEGIDYLGELAGNIWTDHNTHDPGITILEMLCYALLDIGYRTGIPDKDLFTRNPDSSEEDNFFTPSQILGCNPVTIADYRRLLIDIPGIKNAWLQVAEDITVNSICSNFQYRSFAPGCKDFLNGLYHVYIDLQNSKLTDPKLIEKERDDIVREVKRVLMAHRNLCEDFYDIKILEKQKIGVCAEIEIDPAADIDQLIRKIITEIDNFFSPSPKFYRLSELLNDKGKSIEEAFAGRPIDWTKSHGFVDNEAFEKIELKKEIHLSDLYNVIFNVAGVNAIQNLRLQNCDKSTCTDGDVNNWIFRLYTDHVPQLSLECSGIVLLRNGAPLVQDLLGYVSFLQNNANAKTLLGDNSGNKDILLPAGTFPAELPVYYPLENDFPKVYGIAEGSLPVTVPDPRKAQSLQLRGYLLFFDQLLAGYLSQLSHIRDYFSFGNQIENEHTYYVNKLNNWPGIDKLLQFATTENDTGVFGSLIASPLKRTALDAMIVNGDLDDCNYQDNLDDFLFCSAAERDTAILQIINDIESESYDEHLLMTKAGCYFFYLETSAKDFVLAGRYAVQTEKAAYAELANIRFMAAGKENYRSYNKTDKFSFTLGAGTKNYWTYIQALLEDKKSYASRKDLFLNHLLARFAESFTDFALLTYGAQPGNETVYDGLLRKQRFLQQYPALSSQRGKGFDYALNGWNNNNVSGYEKKLMAYAGIDGPFARNLCNFEVISYEEQSLISLAYGGEVMMSSVEPFDNRAEAKTALREMLTAMDKRENYSISAPAIDGLVNIKLETKSGSFISGKKFSSDNEAEKAIANYQRFSANQPAEENIFVTQYEHDIYVQRKSDNQLWKRVEPLYDADKDLQLTPSLLDDFGKEGAWASDPANEAKPVLAANPIDVTALIDTFRFDTDFNRIDARDGIFIYNYTFNDKHTNSFFFISTAEYDDTAKANIDLLALLFKLTDRNNYQKKQESENVWRITVADNGKPVAINTVESESGDAAETAIKSIIEFVQNSLYSFASTSKPVRWKYRYIINPHEKQEMVFTSVREYNDYNEVGRSAEELFNEKIKYKIIATAENSIELKDEKHPGTPLMKYEGAEIPSVGVIDSANDLLVAKKAVIALRNNETSTEADAMIVKDASSQRGNYGYLLVDKSKYEAWYALPGDYSVKADRDRAIRELYKRFRAGEHYLEICYGGDNINERKEANGSLWYHFIIKTHQPNITGSDELVLFESVIGYTSPEEAQQAFNLQFVNILQLASDTDNYGKQISFTEKLVHGGTTSEETALVFIPDETMKLFGYNNEYAAEQLALLSDSYPIKQIGKKSDEFKKYFVCSSDVDSTNPEPACCDCCAGEMEPNVYYYKYGTDDGKTGYWISQEYFTSLNEALFHFRHFLDLLHYKGNYHIAHDECDCSWRLYIREIMAVSKDRFATAAEAWGKEGVEKFICASQTEGGFQTLRHDCCHTFVVSCGNTGLQHPCTYDTAASRDAAIMKLVNAAKDLLAKLENGEGPKSSPVFSKMLNGTEKFYVEIKFDDTCGSELPPYPTSGCEEQKDDECIDCCCTGWVSDCCFRSKEEAYRFFLEEMRCLTDVSNYYGVYDCECGPYGIKFYCSCEEKRDKHCCNDIIAFNPQCYISAAKACDAVQRSKKLINAEGMHLVEHILLRPHCVDGDCKCVIEPCDAYTRCRFVWPVQSDDPCEKDKKYCFVPGEDPYSFIATAFLPAWPERFRQPENRMMLEQRLYSELPAHIMLRVLWVTPRELCFFEKIFHDWRRWLAGKKVCTDYDPACTLIGFLFKHPFECFECEDCIPCIDDGQASDPCGRHTKVVESSPYDYTNAINDLYCWKPICREDQQQAKPVTNIAHEVLEEDGIPAADEALDELEAERKLDERFSKYFDEIKAIAADSKNTIAEQALAFTRNPNHEFENFNSLIKNIIANKTNAESQRRLNMNEKKILVKALLWQYLDVAVLKENVEQQKGHLKELFLKLDDKQLLPEYKTWKGDEVLQADKKPYLQEVKKLFKK